MNESLQSGWARCGGLNFWLQLLAWVFLCLAFPSSLQVPQGRRGPCCVLAVVPHCPQKTPAGASVLCLAAWAVSPPGQLSFPRNDNSVVLRAQLPTAVCACSWCLYTRGVNTIAPFVLKRDPWTMSAVPNPFGPSHISKTRLDSLLPLQWGGGWLACSKPKLAPQLDGLP